MSHILDQPSVVLNGVDAMKFLAQNQDRTLISTYPKSVIELLGPNVLLNSDGPTHEGRGRSSARPSRPARLHPTRSTSSKCANAMRKSGGP